MSQSIAITGADVLVGNDLAVVSDATVVATGGAIDQVGPATDVDVPSHALAVDAAGLVLVPGFIDAHVHIGLYDPSQVLAGGVTTARDLGWPPEQIHPLARKSAEPDFDGPMVVAAGPMLTAPGGYPARAYWAPPGTAREVDGSEDARAAVARTADEGACVIKVALNPAAGPTLNGEVLRAIVEAAHTRGLKVTGHVHGVTELTKALDAGMDELAHMLMSSEPIPEEIVERMVEQRTVVVPTLSIRFGRDQRIAIDNLHRFLEAGGSIVYGTDLGNAGPRPGIDRREVRALQKAGLSGRAIIAAATVESAAWLGLSSKGVIAPGMDADLVAVAGDPLGDPKTLANVRMVWRGGRRAG